MRLGITGIGKCGKTTLLNLLTGAGHDTGKFAATRQEVLRGVSHVPDERLERLAAVWGSKNAVPVGIDFLDFAGLAIGSEGESKLLGELRLVDALVHVLRAFDDPDLPHPAGSLNPARDAAAQEAELILADLIVVEGRLKRVEEMIGKARSDELLRERELMLRIREELEGDRPLRRCAFSTAEEHMLRGFGFLSAKPLLLVLNVGEGDVTDLEAAIERWGLAPMAGEPRVEVCRVSAALELEISRLEPEDRAEFVADLGVRHLGADRVIRSAYSLLGLITFLTANEREAHAWPLREGSTALEAAGAIHADMQRGFIRAEVISIDELEQAGSFAEARQEGKLRVEGRDYVVRDGDVLHIRFNV